MIFEEIELIDFDSVGALYKIIGVHNNGYTVPGKILFDEKEKAECWIKNVVLKHRVAKNYKQFYVEEA